MSLFLIFWIRCHFLLYTKTKGDKDVMIKKITVKGNSVIVHISTKSKTELTFLMRSEKHPRSSLILQMDEKSTIRKVLFHGLIFLCYSSPQVPVISLAVYLAMILSSETTLGSQTIRENEEQLKSIRKWGGQSSKNGLWDEIQRYKKLFISKFGIVI